MKDVEIGYLLNKTITKIEGMESGSTKVLFHLSNGEQVAMFHHQDCCESVDLNDVIGEVEDLIGSEILKAEESTSSRNDQDECESCTWTFYKLATIKGHVDLRWFGSSNGYYSESVDMAIVSDKEYKELD